MPEPTPQIEGGERLREIATSLENGEPATRQEIDEIRALADAFPSPVLGGVGDGRKPHDHDSTRLDGWLDNCCMHCGVDGYWLNGQRVDISACETKQHPSGKLLAKPQPQPHREEVADRPSTDEIRGKLESGYLFCHPENDCEGQKAWLRAAGERDLLRDALRTLVERGRAVYLQWSTGDKGERLNGELFYAALDVADALVTATPPTSTGGGSERHPILGSPTKGGPQHPVPDPAALSDTTKEPEGRKCKRCGLSLAEYEASTMPSFCSDGEGHYFTAPQPNQGPEDQPGGEQR